MRETFQAVSGKSEAQPLFAQIETAFAGLASLLAAATPTPMATDAPDDQELQMDKERDPSHDGLAWARSCQRSLEGLPEEEREAKKAKIAELLEPRQV